VVAINDYVVIGVTNYYKDRQTDHNPWGVSMAKLTERRRDYKV